MNVTGVGGAASTPPVPAPVRPVTEPDPAHRHTKDDGAAAAAAAQQAAQAAQERRAAEKLPPLKPLSTTEMRVILGAIPPNQLNRKVDPTQPGSTFDTYA